MEITTKSKQSINLIPESEREKSLTSKFFPLIICFVIILATLLVYVALLLLNIGSEKSLADTKSQIETASAAWQKYEPIASSVKAIISKKASYDQGVLKYSGFDQKLDTIRADIPDGIEYSTMLVSLDGKATVSGKASDPKIIYQYYNGLLAKNNYSAVNLTSVSKDSSLIYNFSLNFTVAGNK